MHREPLDVDRLALYLKALAHPGRLELLHLLRVPRAAGDIHLQPRRRDAGLSPERAISRQSVLEHLATLEEVGVVDRVPGEAGGAEKRALNQPRLFAIIEDMRALTAIDPAVRVDVDATVPRPPAEPAAWPEGAKLVLVSGPWEGRVFPLAGAGPWSVGRSRARDVALAYDPFASAEHAALRLEGGQVIVTPSPQARNPTSVNFSPLAPQASRALRPGDVVGVGRSLLVYQGP